MDGETEAWGHATPPGWLSKPVAELGLKQQVPSAYPGCFLCSQQLLPALHPQPKAR